MKVVDRYIFIDMEILCTQKINGDIHVKIILTVTFSYNIIDLKYNDDEQSWITLVNKLMRLAGLNISGVKVNRNLVLLNHIKYTCMW